MVPSSFIVFSLSCLPLVIRCAPASLSHLGLLSTRRPEGGQALLAATPLSTATQNATTNQTLSASYGSILFSPDTPTLSLSQESPTTYSTRPLVMAYYPDWAGPSFGPEQINFDLYDWVDFAFGIPDASFGVTWDSPESPEKLHGFVDAAHRKSTKVKLSLGGWTGSKYFSPAVASSESRETFARSILDIYNRFNLDGIDIDWEYPGHEGSGGNKIDPNDSMNFLLLLEHLRAILPPIARITAAVQTVPFVDASGRPMKDVSKFAEVLDWVLIMNYDVWPSSLTPGSNAPMNDGCHNSSQPNANAVAAFNAWTAAGFPASKLVLGLPSYGYVSDSQASSLRSRSSSRAFRPIERRSLDDGSEESGTTVKITGEDGSSTVQFRDLVRQGALVRVSPTTTSSPAVYNATGGFTRYWDACSSTPWLRSTSVKQVIAYDDPGSLRMKAEFARNVGMLGVNMFDVHGDTEDYDLIHAVRQGLADM